MKKAVDEFVAQANRIAAGAGRRALVALDEVALEPLGQTIDERGQRFERVNDLWRHLVKRGAAK